MALIIVEITLKAFLISRFFLFFFNAFFLFLYSIFLFLKSLFTREYVSKTKDTPVSVIIPTYNEEKNIANCLSCILKSNYQMDKIELILVNDRSTDNTLIVAKKLLNKFHAYKVVLGDHVGKSDALNKGIMSAKNEMIVFVDADVQVGTNHLRLIVNSLRDKRIGCSVGPVLYRQNNILSRFQSLEFKILNLTKSVYVDAFGAPLGVAGGQTFGTKKSVLKKVGYFQNDTLVEDTDLFARIYLHNYRATFLSKAVCYTLPMLSLVSLFKQRMRWYYGGIQIIGKYGRKIFKKPYFIYYSVLTVSWYITSIFVFIAITLFGAHSIFENGIKSSLLILSKMTLLGNLMIVKDYPQFFIIHLFIISYYIIAVNSFSKVKSVLDYLILIFYPTYITLLQLCAFFSLVKYYRKKNLVFIKS